MSTLLIVGGRGLDRVCDRLSMSSTFSGTSSALSMTTGDVTRVVALRKGIGLSFGSIGAILGSNNMTVVDANCNRNSGHIDRTVGGTRRSPLLGGGSVFGSGGMLLGVSCDTRCGLVVDRVSRIGRFVGHFDHSFRAGFNVTVSSGLRRGIGVALLTANFNVRSVRVGRVSSHVARHATRRRRHLTRLRRRRRREQGHHRICCNGSTGTHSRHDHHHRVCLFGPRSVSGTSVVDVMRGSPACLHSGDALGDVGVGTRRRKRLTARTTRRTRNNTKKIVAF